MKTKTLFIIITGAVLLIVSVFLQTTLYEDGGDFLQGLASGILIGGLMAAFTEWREKRVGNRNAAHEAK